MDFIRGQNTPYFHGMKIWFQIMISDPLSYRGFRETGPWSHLRQIFEMSLDVADNFVSELVRDN